jgi:porin
MGNVARVLVWSILCIMGVLRAANAEDAVDYRVSTLTGDWGGYRTTLAEAGVATEMLYKADLMGNVSGGIARGVRGLDNLDVMFTLDGARLADLQGTSAMVHLLNNNGGRPDADLMGSAQWINNIEVPKATGKLYQAWIQQLCFDDVLSIRGGLYDLNTEFYVNDPSMLFIHSTYGIGTDMAQSGRNGPSIFPFTSLGLRVKVQPTPQVYAQAVVLDGVSGNPNNPRGTQIDLSRHDGALWAGETGITSGGEHPNGKIAIGGWYYTSAFDDHVDTDGAGNPIKRHNKGAYLIADREVYRVPGSETRSLSIFGRFGIADKHVSQCDYAWSTGLVYTGLVPHRAQGQLGVGIAGAHASAKYRQAQRLADIPTDAAEIAIELTYSDNLTPWVKVQPDIQYIVNPGLDPTLDNALAVGARVTIAF